MRTQMRWIKKINLFIVSCLVHHILCKTQKVVLIFFFQHDVIVYFVLIFHFPLQPQGCHFTLPTNCALELKRGEELDISKETQKSLGIFGWVNVAKWTGLWRS